MMSRRRVAIIGSGPTGLEAALAAWQAQCDFTLYEADESVAGNVRAWSHVRLFTPWSMNVSPRVRAFLKSEGYEVPAGSDCPTGADLVRDVFEPLARSAPIAPRLRLATRVTNVAKDGLLKSDEIGTGRRSAHPFRLLLRDSDGRERVDYADVVLDCSGTYHMPNALGIGGIPAPGEHAAGERIIRQIPDFEVPLSATQRLDWAGERILLVGAGHSAQTAAVDLAGLVDRHPDTRVVWAIRNPAPTFGAIDDDALPAREALVRDARALAHDTGSPFDVRVGRAVHALSSEPDGIDVELRRADGSSEHVFADRILSLTGSVGDARMYRQLQVHECYATSGPMRLAAALLASSSEDCLTQESHGPDTLRNPEPDFFILGSKSYGRNTTFLMRVGWEQVADVFALLDAPLASVSETATV